MKPVLLNYYLTYRCNAACSFCDIWERPSPLVKMEDVSANLSAARKLGARIVDFTGGEPLLHTQLPVMLSEAKKLGFVTTVTTNGLLYPKRAEAMKGDVDLLHFSIDSADREEHNKSREVDCFDSLMESLDLALSIGERPDLIFTVTNQNVDQLDRIYNEISRPNKIVLLINPLFEYNGLGDSLSKEVMARVRSFAKKSYTYLNPAFLTLREKGGNDPENPVCKAVSTTIVISPFNELLLPCYHAAEESIPISGNLEELWYSDVVKTQRASQGRLDVCKGCTINCYFEPSFATSPGGRYFWESLPSKVGYTTRKFLAQPLANRLGSRRNFTREVHE